jgi:hypothetical protein
MSIQVEVIQRGLDLRVFGGEIKNDVVPGLVKTAADYAEALMSAKAPVRSGRLLGSIRKIVSENEAIIGPTVPYAVYVEYGTSPHEIRPVSASVLAFEVAGKMVFTPIVHHPGTKPNPFIRETAEAVRDQIPVFWNQAIKRVVE